MCESNFRNADSAAGLVAFIVGGYSIRINHPSIKVGDCFIRVGDCSIREGGE